MDHFKFFQNRSCEYFPCHKGVSEDAFNCLFCFCPLYALGDKCGGNFTYTKEHVKDCSNCARPHLRNNYDSICSGVSQVIEMVKNDSNESENA